MEHARHGEMQVRLLRLPVVADAIADEKPRESLSGTCRIVTHQAETIRPDALVDLLDAVAAEILDGQAMEFS